MNRHILDYREDISNQSCVFVIPIFVLCMGDCAYVSNNLLLLYRTPSQEDILLGTHDYKPYD